MTITKNKSRIMGMIFLDRYRFLFKDNIETFVYKCMSMLCTQVNYNIGLRSKSNSLYKMYVTLTYTNDESDVELNFSNKMSDTGILRSDNLMKGYANCYDWVISKVHYYNDFTMKRITIRVREIDTDVN